MMRAILLSCSQALTFLCGTVLDRYSPIPGKSFLQRANLVQVAVIGISITVRSCFIFITCVALSPLWTSKRNQILQSSRTRFQNEELLY